MCLLVMIFVDDEVIHYWCVYCLFICFVNYSSNLFDYGTCIFHTCVYGLFSVFQEFTS